MNVPESLRMSLRAIRSHRLRSVLTTLGVVIGVAAVITFVALGASLQAAVVGEVAGAQSPTMIVTVGPEDAPGGGPGVGTSQPVFTEHDASAIAELEAVSSVVPTGSVPVSGVSYRNQTLGFQSVTATTPGAFEATGNDNFSAGGPFALGENEVVLNQVAAALFASPVEPGSSLTLIRAGGRSVEATVVGIVQSESTFGGTPQPQLYVPTEPFYDLRLTSPSTGAEQRTYPTLVVTASSFEELDAARDRVLGYLETDSDARTLKPATFSFTVQTVAGLLEQIREIIGLFTSFVTGIAVISLVVGAIGIANIMLVSVTERTREIGIMKAVGAQNRDVLQLFLLEAVLLGVVGAGLGAGLGAVAAYAAAEYIGIALTFPLEWVGIAIAVGVGVGVVAGLYPAWDAARTDPIDALRYE